MAEFCQSCKILKVVQVICNMISSCISKITVWILVSDGQNSLFTIHNVYTICLALLFFICTNLCTDSVGLRFKRFDMILQSLSKIFACLFRMLIVAFFFRRARLKAVLAKDWRLRLAFFFYFSVEADSIDRASLGFF